MLRSRLLPFLLFLILSLTGGHLSASHDTTTADNYHFSDIHFDSRFPDMIEWAKAGVRGGIPSHDTIPVIMSLPPGGNIQAAIDSAASHGGGAVLLRAGTYIVTDQLYLRDGVVLRGEGPESTVIESRLTSHFSDPLSVSTLNLNGITHAGIEDLTVRYAAADFPPTDYDDYDHPWEKDTFENDPGGNDSLYVSQVTFNGAADCWVLGCRLLNAGTDPIMISDSEHITCRGNTIDRCYNKGGGGNGYYSILGSKYVLITQETVKRIRHFVIRGGSKYCVVYDCDFEVDVNFHDGDGGHNLIEGNRVMIPVWHSWHCFSSGVPNQHRPPGFGNIIFNNTTDYKNRGPECGLQGVVYTMRDTWDTSPACREAGTEPPSVGTFYQIDIKNAK